MNTYLEVIQSHGWSKIQFKGGEKILEGVDIKLTLPLMMNKSFFFEYEAHISKQNFPNHQIWFSMKYSFQKMCNMELLKSNLMIDGA